jgi:predicted HTH domain antitoxin
VRCGRVAHPRQWGWLGYHEMMGQRQRYRMLDLDRLCWRLQADDPTDLRNNLEAALAEQLAQEQFKRETCWTEGLAVGSAMTHSVPLATTASIGHRDAMELTLPKPWDERLSPQKVALHLAIGLFVTQEATLGQAAQTAGLSQTDFLRELGRHQIPIHYSLDELAEDLKTVDALAAQ